MQWSIDTLYDQAGCTQTLRIYVLALSGFSTLLIILVPPCDGLPKKEPAIHILLELHDLVVKK